MKIAVASGKGGTGKTTLAVALAGVVTGKVKYIDCDVEEPNGNIFLKAPLSETNSVNIYVPEINTDKCTGCGSCVEFCEFNALTVVNGKALIFADMCHSCGGCQIICPEGAIEEITHKVGVLHNGKKDNIMLHEGLLDVGSVIAIPCIKAAKKKIADDLVNIIDCPPGASCPLMESVRGTDYVILITEPTPFGLHDLRIVVDTVKKQNLKFGVVVNRYIEDFAPLTEYLNREGIDLLLKIPEQRNIAELYSHGENLLLKDSVLKNMVQDLLAKVMKEIIV